MNPIKRILYKHSLETIKDLEQRHYTLKKSIVAQLALQSEATIAELAKGINSSVPTTTKFIEELLTQRVVEQRGKAQSRTGRKAELFGLADSSLYFLGLEIDQRGLVRYVATDIHNETVKSGAIEPFAHMTKAHYTPEKIAEIALLALKNADIEKENVLGLGIAIPAWVNTAEGSVGVPPIEAANHLATLLDMEVILENRARASLYAEYTKEEITNHNIIYLHLAQSLSVGVIMEGQLQYGQSGFAGEFGHAPMFDNEIICECGKKGCLQSEVSGTALKRELIIEMEQGTNSSLRELLERKIDITLSDIMDAAHANDSLSIEMIGRIGARAGRAVASMLAMLNPGLVIVGGELSQAGDYLMLPLKGAVNRHSHTLLYSGTEIRATKMNVDVAALGVAMLIRNKILEL